MLGREKWSSPLLVLALCLLIGRPSALRAQTAGFGGAAVVPPSRAYLWPRSRVGDWSLRRWQTRPDGNVRMLRIYFAPGVAPKARFEASEHGMVSALRRWISAADLPLRLELTPVPARADVTVRWIDHFDDDRAGSTHWRTDEDGWIRRVVVTLAMRHANGSPISSELLRYVYLHEAGHVLGLPHSENPRDVMHPASRNLDFSNRDIHSVRRLYSLKPWSLLPDEP